ncbi:hypothetical protein RJP56_18770 [Shewanella baltica]|uniref:hypothetical protein n=1 Tax=Shewanella baltica TaxID=62322 RepID=UPI0028728826|nr:hypothetical protein [Shewanella baltica]MDR9768108.1 hypothetical protein [Shewanella baltica]
MEIEGRKYTLVVTSANDFDTLSLECTLDNELIIEAEIVSYKEKQAKIHFHKSGLSLKVVEAFINEVNKELIHGRQKNS